VVSLIHFVGVCFLFFAFFAFTQRRDQLKPLAHACDVSVNVMGGLGMTDRLFFGLCL
jgi:hypothetical protein